MIATCSRPTAVRQCLLPFVASLDKVTVIDYTIEVPLQELQRGPVGFRCGNRRYVVKLVMTGLVFFISGCVTVNSMQELLTADEIAKRDYYKCSQGIPVDIGSLSNASGGAALTPTALSTTPFLAAPMIISSMHYKRVAIAPIADITIVDVVNATTVSSYFAVMSYCRSLGCDQPGKTCLEVDAKLLGYDRDYDAAVEVLITKTPADLRFPREYTTYRKMKLKGPAFEVTEITEDEALRIREYYRDQYYSPSRKAGTSP